MLMFGKLLNNLIISTKNSRKTSLSDSIIRRFISQTKRIPDPAEVKILPDKYIADFESHFPIIVKEILDENLVTHISRVNNRLKNILEYNVPFGKKLRPHLMVATYNFITEETENATNSSQENIKLVNILAWCIEMMNAAYLIQDDIVDNSATRRGKSTWFKCSGVGMHAINDSLLLEAAYLQLLKKYFSSHRNYSQILEVFINMKRTTCVGQVLEGVTTSLEDFTIQTYRDIAENKMGFYTYHSPVFLGTFLANRGDLKICGRAERVLRELGYIYTIQNDYLDCYGEDYSGKLGTDIQESRCTWLILRALQRATPEQKIILKECYGKEDINKVQAVKRIYDALDILSEYYDVERQIHENILAEIENVSDDQIRNMLKWLIAILFRQ